MAQRLKAEVRERILAAAEEVFAVHGFEGAKMSDIAAAADLSTGNLYRYFAGKDALFHEVIDPDFVARFDVLLDRRVRALFRVRPRELDEDAHAAAEQMLSFWIENRRRVVVLLDRCEGSRYEGFGRRFVERLVTMTVEHLGKGGRRSRPRALMSLTLTTAFDTSRRAVVSILETYATEPEIRLAFEAFWSFQLAGLAGFERWVNDE